MQKEEKNVVILIAFWIVKCYQQKGIYSHKLLFADMRRRGCRINLHSVINTAHGIKRKTEEDWGYGPSRLQLTI